MSALPRITLEGWDRRYEELRAAGLAEPPYGGPLRRHVDDGDYRLRSIRYDASPAALRLWNFLLTEEDRLRERRAAGHKLVGTMKDLGTVPVMAYSLPEVTAFYPDGAWWIPCVMELSAGLLGVADRLGIDESFCPVRAMLGAFVTEAHFPMPDTLICSAGAVCDDFSAIAQRLQGFGRSIVWWEIPTRRAPDPDEEAVPLPGGGVAPRAQVDFVRDELARLRGVLEGVARCELTDDMLAAGIAEANRARRLLADLRETVFAADPCPLPALEMLVAEMLIIHFCSDRDETIEVLEDLLAEARRRADRGEGVLDPGAVRVFWVNPVADLTAMNRLEDSGGRVCGTEYLFTHALDPIPEDVPPLEGLARAALADPMIGSASERARRIVRDAAAWGAEAVLVSRIPGASHCATEGGVIAGLVDVELGVPVLELEVPPVADSLGATLRTRLEALVETVISGRRR